MGEQGELFAKKREDGDSGCFRSEGDERNQGGASPDTLPQRSEAASVEKERRSLNSRHNDGGNPWSSISHIECILDIKTATDGVLVRALVELREECGIIRLVGMDWNLPEQWRERVKELISELAYKAAESLSRVRGCARLDIYTKFQLEDVVNCDDDRRILLNGAALPRDRVGELAGYAAFLKQEAASLGDMARQH